MALEQSRSTEDILERFQRRVRSVESDSTSEIDRRRLDYRQAAAVLHVFALSELRPVRLQEDNGAATVLFDDTIPATGWADQGLRTLRQNVRREAIRTLGSRAALRDALKANPERRTTEVQRLFERWLVSDKLDLATLSSRQLQAATVLCDWGLEQFGFPPQRNVEEAWLRRSVVAPFEILAEGFIGRKAELETLRQYVGLSESSLWSRARAFLRRGSAVGPLVAFGPGGIGKTALIARFILDYFDSRESSRFPFVYLPFDDPSLDAGEPSTLIAATFKQIEAHCAGNPELAGNPDVVRTIPSFRKVLDDYLDRREGLSSRAARTASQRERIDSLHKLDRQLKSNLTKVLRVISEGSSDGTNAAPILFVLDSYEEVEFRTARDLQLLWNFFDELAKSLPQIRIVVAGRSSPHGEKYGKLRAQFLPLEELTPEDAAILLQRLGVDNREVVDAVINQVGRSPLTLRLAARVLRDEDANASGIRGLSTTRFGLFRIGPELIRGLLYRRILDHIHDPDARALAHPGMALRRVTPEIIRDVLAPVCGLGYPTLERAEELFRCLHDEHTLVQLDETGALRYREEIRRPMLALLTSDKPSQTEQLHRVVADYYADQNDDISRAEEIYHLLMQGDRDWYRIEFAMASQPEKIS